MQIGDDEINREIFKIKSRERSDEIDKRCLEPVPKPIKVFLSYSHSDEALVERIEANFRENAIDYWKDKKEKNDLKPGDRIIEKVQQAISSCSHYLLVLSPNSVNSKWCIAEHSFAIGKQRRSLFLLTDKSLQIPPMLQPFLGTYDLKEIIQYLERYRIEFKFEHDPDVVERFISEIIYDSSAKPKDFILTKSQTRTHRVWDAANRTRKGSNLPLTACL